MCRANCNFSYRTFGHNNQYSVRAFGTVCLNCSRYFIYIGKLCSRGRVIMKTSEIVSFLIKTLRIASLLITLIGNSGLVRRGYHL